MTSGLRVVIVFRCRKTSLYEICSEISYVVSGRQKEYRSRETHVLMYSGIEISPPIIRNTDSPASLVRLAAKRASHNRCWMTTARPSNFHPEIYRKSVSVLIHCKEVGYTNEIINDGRSLRLPSLTRASSND